MVRISVWYGGGTGERMWAGGAESGNRTFVDHLSRGRQAWIVELEVHQNGRTPSAWVRWLSSSIDRTG